MIERERRDLRVEDLGKQRDNVKCSQLKHEKQLEKTMYGKTRQLPKIFSFEGEIN